MMDFIVSIVQIWIWISEASFAGVDMFVLPPFLPPVGGDSLWLRLSCLGWCLVFLTRWLRPAVYFVF